MATGGSGGSVEAAQGSQGLAPSSSLDDLAGSLPSSQPGKKEFTRAEAIALIESATGSRVGLTTLYALGGRGVLDVTGYGGKTMITAKSLQRMLQAMKGYKFLNVKALAANLRMPLKPIEQRLEQLAAEDTLVMALGRRVRGEQAWQESARPTRSQEFYVLAAGAGRHDELVIKLLEGMQRTAYPAAYVDAELAIQLGIKPDSDQSRNIKSHFLERVNPGGVNPAYSAGVVDGFFARVQDYKSLDYKAIRDKLGKPETGLFLNLLDLESQQPGGVILKLSRDTIGTRPEYFLRRGVSYQELAERMTQLRTQLETNAPAAFAPAQASQAPAKN